MTTILASDMFDKGLYPKHMKKSTTTKNKKPNHPIKIDRGMDQTFSKDTDGQQAFKKMFNVTCHQISKRYLNQISTLLHTCSNNYLPKDNK